jgi:hypothetical protein
MVTGVFGMYEYDDVNQLRAFIENQVMFTNEAAKYLGVSPQRLHQLVQAGRLKPIKTNPAGTIFLKSDLEARKREDRKQCRCCASPESILSHHSDEPGGNPL